MSVWKEVTLTSLGSFGRGRSRHRPRNDPSLYGGKYPFFQTGDIKAAEFYLTMYSQTYNERGLSQSKIWPAGTLCITIAANIAETALLGIEGCFPDSVVRFQCYQDKSDVRFIKYLFDHMKARYQQISKGTTQDNLSLQKLFSLTVRVPPLLTQKRIAGILSAYDDLIAVNERRIAILEEMARRVFEEWYTRNNDHKDRQIAPDGWSDGVLDDVVVLQRGFDLPKQKREPGNFPIVSATGVSGSHTEGKVAGPSVVTGRSGSIGTVQLIWQDHWPLNTTLWSKSLPAGSLFYAFYILQSIDLSSFNSGAAVPTLYRNDIKNLLIKVPPSIVLQKFDAIVQPMHIQIEALRKQNTNLRSTRDLLLPRLISGEIGVSELPETVAAE